MTTPPGFEGSQTGTGAVLRNDPCKGRWNRPRAIGKCLVRRKGGVIPGSLSCVNYG